MNDQEEFAQNITKFIIKFMEKIDSVSGLENYYLANRAPISQIRGINEDCHAEVIQAFKDKKGSILDKQLIIKALSDYGKPMLAKKKNTREEKQEMDRIRGIISQLAFGRDDDV